MFDKYTLREIARTPFMLKVIVEVLLSIAAKSIYDQDLLQARILTSYQLIDRFTDRAIQSNAQRALAIPTGTESEEDANKSEKS